MKKIVLLLIVLSSGIISCNSEEITKETPVVTEPGSTSMVSMPHNPVNPYDPAGKAYIDIFNAYHLINTENDTTITKIRQRINDIALTNTDLMLLNQGYTTTDVSAEEIEQILKNPAAKLEEVITGSSLSSTAKTELKNFIDEVQLLENKEYEYIYNYIVSFEASVIENTKFNNFDKRVLLLTSTLIRHWSYNMRKRGDKDWSKSTGNFVGAVKGAIISPYTAVTTSLVSRIALNKNVMSR
ncbi:hypothetical protein [Flavobacterium poyangense]|uniref:hypothetical protein n=1 Tax=Flavobacterium poyangense TaxID=2204302 RepID=UPI001421AB2B|nr:hypothetical protein [Flavobacterium sp. JXAS1]